MEPSADSGTQHAPAQRLIELCDVYPLGHTLLDIGRRA